MLTKRKDYMTSKAGVVKKWTRSSLAVLALCTASIAPNAFAGDSPLIDKTVTVKFKYSDLASDDGVEKVYTKIKKRAISYCRADSHTLQYLAQTKGECIADLMDQFVDSANVDALKMFHQSHKFAASGKKYALN